METGISSPFASALERIQQSAASASSSQGLQQEVVTTISARLRYYDWVGFYMLDDADPGVLVLGPFAGEPTPHVRIPVAQGICGAAVAARSTIVVDDVLADPRYLSCSINTRSEIVAPILVSGQVVGEIDVDSHTAAAFTSADREFLEEVARMVGGYIAARPP